MRTTALLVTSSLIALGGLPAAPVALAQEGQGAVLNFDDIIITARKKEETLQNAPLAVAVVGAEMIESKALSALEDVAKLTPGFVFDNEFGRQGNRPVIRGQANILGDSGVSIFIDGVLFTGGLADYDVSDVARFEIIKGPQSALYGRNTYSGAINIITKAPTQELSGNVTGRVISNNTYEATGAISGAIIPDVLSARLSARYYKYDGEFRNAFDGRRMGKEETKSVAGTLYFTPNEALDIRARVYYAQSDDGQPAFFATSASENNCLFDNGALYGGDGRYYCGIIEPRQVNVNDTEQVVGGGEQDTDTLQTSLSINYDFGDGFTLTSTTGYNKQDTIQRLDADYQPTSFQTAVFTPGGFIAGAPVFGPTGPRFPFGYVGSTVDFTFEDYGTREDLSTELRLNYDSDMIEILVGGFFLDSKDDSTTNRLLPSNAAAVAGASFAAALVEQQALCAANPTCLRISPFFGPTVAGGGARSELGVQNWALFGRVGVNLTEQFSVAVEARYAEDKFEDVAYNADGSILLQESTTFDSFNPRFSTNYKITDQNLLYASVAKGNKPGGFNGTTAIQAGIPTFEEEEVWAYEAGTKNQFMDRQITFNLAAFFNDISGYQLTQNVQNLTTGNTTSATVNAGDAEIKGIEVELIARPRNTGLMLSVSYAYTDGKFNKGVDENQGVLDDVADDGLVNCSTGDQFPSDTTCQSLFGSIVGKRIPRSAEHQLYADLGYRHELDSGWTLSAGADISYTSTRFSQVHNLAETGDATLVGVRIGAENDRFRLTAFGQNIFDEDSTPFILRYADGADSFKRSFVGILRRGARWGIQGTVKF